jgi:Zn-dependent peptidase ImmA (M78 family)
MLSGNHEEENKAQGFAAEFLMPEDGVKDSFFKVVGEAITGDKIEARHVIRMQHIFQVSYAAMLKRLIQLDLCAVKRYDFLREYGNVERTEELQQITLREGYEVHLIQPSKITSISDEYIQATRSNFEKKNISYGKLLEVLAYVGKTPLGYGYEPYGEEE